MERTQRLKTQCLEMKMKALDMALLSGSFGAHIGGAFSSMEIMAALLEVSNIAPEDKTRDRIIMSKGHSALSLYTGLWQKGYISESELMTYDQNGTLLHGHPNRDIAKRLEFPSGSLGLGVSYSVGVALACRKKSIDNTIYCIVGDGECDEGIVWEAIQFASHNHLTNLTIIVDNNGYQLDGPTKEVMNQGNIADKFSAFGFDVAVVDGHGIDSLLNVLSLKSNKPRAIIANTIKAHGISFLENNKLSHHCSLTKKKYQQAVEDIRRSYGLE